MRNRGIVQVAWFILLQGAVIITSANEGKKVLIKIHVPKVTNHKYHTNVVYVHKHHDHDHDHYEDHYEDDGPVHSYGDHHSYSHGEPQAYRHSYNVGHRHHYSYSQGNDPDKYNLGGGSAKQKPELHHSQPGNANRINNGHNQNHSHQTHFAPKQVTEAPKTGYSFKASYKDPEAKTHHYSYVAFSPTFRINGDNRLKQLNQTGRHGQTKVENVGVLHPDAEGIRKAQTKDNYDVQGRHPFELDFQDYEKEYAGGFSGNNANERKKGPGDYSEDYTNPSSVSKYTSAIQHGAIGLVDSNYNGDHGNDLDLYINGYNGPFEKN